MNIEILVKGTKIYTDNKLTSIDFNIKGYHDCPRKTIELVGDEWTGYAHNKLDLYDDNALYINTYTYDVPEEHQYTKSSQEEKDNHDTIRDLYRADSGFIAKKDDIRTKLEEHNG